MKVLAIALLVCAVTVIQVVEAQISFFIQFTETRYDVKEDETITVTVEAADTSALPDIFEILVTVEVQETEDCMPGVDLLLQNGTSANLKLRGGSISEPSTASFDIKALCDGIVEGIDQQCTLVIRDNFTFIPDDIQNALMIVQNMTSTGRAPLDIAECDEDFIECKWDSSERVEVSEETSPRVELFATCEGRYSASIRIPVSCVPNDVEGFVTPATERVNDMGDWSVGSRILNFETYYTNLTTSLEPIIITIFDDVEVEGTESLICSIQAGVAEAVRTVEPKQVTIVIRDDEVLRMFWAKDIYCFNESVGDALTMLETNSSFNDTIQLTAFPREIDDDAENVQVVRFPSTATFRGEPLIGNIKFITFRGTQYAIGEVGPGGDIEATTPQFTFPPKAKFSSSNFTIINDTIYEYDKLVRADFEFDRSSQRRFNTIKGQPNETYIVIKDDDTVDICFTEDSYTVSETEGSVSITLRVTGKYFVLMSTTVTCRAGNATNDDFKFNETTVQFPMPLTSSSATSTTDIGFNIAIVDDQEHEEKECFTCTFDITSAPGRERLCPTSSTTICIVDPVITCGFSQNVTVREGSPAELKIICDQAPDTDITLTVTTMDNTANSPIDYTGGVFTVPIRENVTMGSQVIQTIQTDTVEHDEDFKAILTIPAGSDNVVIGINTTYVTIVDTTVVTCGFSQNLSISEGSPAVLNVVCDKAPISNITFNVTSMNNTANSPSDYTGGTFTVTIRENETMGSLSITTIKTDLVEDDKDFKATLSIHDGPDNVLVGIDTAYVTIVDRTVLVSFNPATYTVTEGVDANAVITLETIGAHSDVITVTVSARSGNATRDSDYQGAMFTVSLPPTNDNISTVNFNVPIVDDNIVECPELLVLELEIPPAAEARCVRKVAPDVAQVLIYDNDVAAVSFNPQNYTVSEGSSVELIIVLDQPACQDISVNVTTVDGTAMDGVDYTGKSSVVSFPAGETRRSFPIATIHDTFVERNDYFKANLSHPLNGPVVFGTPTIAFVNIIDDDVVTISFSTQSYTVPEGSFVNLIIVADKVSPEDITVVVTTTDITTDPDDYDGGTLTCIIPQGENETSCPPLRTHLNVPSEDNEVFRATLSLPVGPDYARVGPDAFVTITDITVVVSFAQSEYIFNETSEREGPITVLARGNLSESNFSIPVTVTDGTATGDGNDYEVPISTPLSFGQDQTSTTLSFTPICDEVEDEGNESVQLTITVPPQYQDYVTTEQPSTTTVIIIDVCPRMAIVDPTPVNDTVMADPLFTVPINTRNTSDILEGTPLCYEVHGRNDTYLNLVSDDCTSVNAYTMEFLVEWVPGEIEAVNVIRVIGVVATDASNECHYIRVEVTDSGMCTAQVDGDSLDSAMFVKNNMTVYHKNNMVRIMVPNCEKQRSRHLVMWVRCQKLRVTDISGDEYTMTKFIISRGLKHRVMAHGLIGQFWGVNFTVVDHEMDGENYTLTMVPSAPSGQDAPRNRTFPAMLSDKTWSLDHKFAMPDSKCLYVGNSQGGPESSLVDSVIEGNWTDYITDSLYETNWAFSRYNAAKCP